MFLLFQEARYEEACRKFTAAMQVTGYQADLSYNIALCFYMMKQYAPALKHIAEVKITRDSFIQPGFFWFLSIGYSPYNMNIRFVKSRIVSSNK